MSISSSIILQSKHSDHYSTVFLLSSSVAASAWDVSPTWRAGLRIVSTIVAIVVLFWRFGIVREELRFLLKGESKPRCREDNVVAFDCSCGVETYGIICMLFVGG